MFLDWILFDDVEDEAYPGVVNLHEEFIWVDVVEALKGLGANNAIFGNTEEPLWNGDAPFPGTPEPVDQDVGQGLIIDLIGTPAVPIGNPQYF